jgi:hypothetical protein
LIYLDSGPSKFGWHRLQTFIACKHLYGLKYPGGVTFRGGLATGLGSLMHVALAHYYAKMGASQGGIEIDPVFVQERPDLVASGRATLTSAAFGLQAHVHDPAMFMDPREAMAWAWDHDPRLLDRREDKLLDKANVIFTQYVKYWGPREKIRALAVEVMLYTEIRSAITGAVYPYTQRLDLAWADSAGGAYIRDHKTAARPDTDVYALEGQFAGFRNFGQMRYGTTFRGVEIGWLQTDKDPYTFKCEAAQYPAEATRDFPALVADTEDELAWYRAGHPDPYAWRRSMHEQICRTRYGKCDAFNLCMGRETLPKKIAL